METNRGFLILCNLILSILLICAHEECLRAVSAYSSAWIISDVIDLDGKTVTMPPGKAIIFKGGILRNGTVIGKETMVTGCTDGCLAVKIEGSWRLPEIRDSYFDAQLLSDNDILSNINHLQNSVIENSIYLTKPRYFIDLSKRGDHALLIAGNTKVFCESEIAIRGNNFISYNIVMISGVDNVYWRGGKITGDVGTHYYVSGSSSGWGHGMNIQNAKNVTVEGLLVQRCTGDGIAITGKGENCLGCFAGASKHVIIDGCVLDSNRRQGMSIIHANDVKVLNCRFINTGTIEKTAPSAGLDIEPNSNAKWKQSTHNIRVERCVSSNNVGACYQTAGFARRDGAESVSNVVFDHCVAEDGNFTIATDGVLLDGCEAKAITLRGTKDKIDRVDIKNSSFSGGHGLLVYYSVSKNENGDRIGGIIDTVYLENCNIRVADNMSDDFYKGAVAYHGGIGGVNHLMCYKTKIYIPSSAGSRYNLTKSANIPDLSFMECEINLPDRMLVCRNAIFSNCIISCKSIDIRDSAEIEARLGTCTINLSSTGY